MRSSSRLFTLPILMPILILPHAAYWPLPDIFPGKKKGGPWAALYTQQDRYQKEYLAPKRIS